MAPTTDITGFRIFDHGDLGQAHTFAHRMLDQDRMEDGYRGLRTWLDDRDGTGSEWVHVQWHMMVFELAVGAWDEAHQRFLRHILPAARDTEDAATDGPAALWRLALAAPRPVELPWDVLHAGAVARMDREVHPYVELHCLLALAGVGDLAGLDRWLARHRPRNNVDQVLGELGRALRAFTANDWANAAIGFSIALPALSLVGGSRAQNQLFEALHLQATSQLGATGSHLPDLGAYPDAAFALA